MLTSLPHAPPHPFSQHIRRLCWFALTAGLVIIARAVQPSLEPSPAATLLAVAVFLGAIWAIVAHVSDYVRREQVRRREAIETAWRAAACQTALTIQDRLANRLSLALGYAEFLADDARLPDDVRQQAQKVMDGARAAAQVVSAVKHELGCDGAQITPDLLSEAPRERLKVRRGS